MYHHGCVDGDRVSSKSHHLLPDSRFASFFSISPSLLYNWSFATETWARYYIVSRKEKEFHSISHFLHSFLSKKRTAHSNHHSKQPASQPASSTHKEKKPCLNPSPPPSSPP